jgi:hypothetical protein
MKREAEILGATTPRPAGLRDEPENAGVSTMEKEPAFRRDAG